MVSRIGIGLAACFLAAVPSAAQEVIRFETSVGDFDMVLNPTNDARLQGHTENMLRYIEDNRYRSSWINRAPENFVLQMGGFYSHTRRPPPTIDSTRGVVPFEPVGGAPAVETGLSNTFGTVALALPSDNFNNPLQDAGTNSFFINLASNTFLDPNFTVFAAIPDMTVINEIMSLMQIDRTIDPIFGAGSNNAAFQDVPIQDNGFQVFIDRAFVVVDPLEVARARAGAQSIVAMASQNSESPSSAPQLATAAVVPEPASAIAFLLGLCGLGACCVRRKRPTQRRLME